MAVKGELDLLHELEKTARVFDASEVTEADFKNFLKVVRPIFSQLAMVRERDSEKRNPKRRFSSLGRGI